jgi:peptidoglycan/LPS O-acetylase OafA/YrhL
LCVEEHFYLLLPLVLLLLQALRLIKRGGWLLIALFLLGFLVREYNWAHFVVPAMGTGDEGFLWYEHIYYPTYNRLDGLLAGVAIAGCYQFLPGLWRRLSGMGNVLIVTSLVVLAGAYYVCYDGQSHAASILGFPLVAVGYGLLVMGAVSPTSFLYKCKLKATSFIATLSYGIYLSHKGVIHITQAAAGKLGVVADSNLMMAISIAGCVAAAFALNLIIEKPFMKMRKRWVG